MLQQAFLEIVHQYTNDGLLAERLWFKIEKACSAKKRHYHTLAHLENLYNQLAECKSEVLDWDVIIFSICYHDIVYNTLKQDNEEKSAALAVKRLQQIGMPAIKIEKCRAQILATKSHKSSTDIDTDLFTDADLSVLGQEWDVYKNYSSGVRKEYFIYPDIIYKPGRKKVLQHFLKMERIFKTSPFFNKFEEQARLNLEREIAELAN